MPSADQLLTALWTLEPQLPKLLDPATVQRLQQRLKPGKQAMIRGDSDGTDLVALISNYPSLQAPWQAALVGADPEASQAETLAALDALLAESDGDTLPPSSTDAPGPEDDRFDDFDDFDDVLLMPQGWGGESKAYEGLAGKPKTAVPGQRYVCPEAGCGETAFRRGSGSVPLCDKHDVAVMMVPAKQEG